MVDVANGSTELARSRLEARVVGRKTLDGVGALIQADGVQQVIAQRATLRGAASAALGQDCVQTPIALGQLLPFGGRQPLHGQQALASYHLEGRGPDATLEGTQESFLNGHNLMLPSRAETERNQHVPAR